MKLHRLFKSQIYLNTIRTYSVRFIFFSLAITWAIRTGTIRSPGTNCQIPASSTAGMCLICGGGLTYPFKFMHLLPLNMSTSFSNELLRRNDRNCELFVYMKPPVRKQIDGRAGTAGNIVSPTVHLLCNYCQSEYLKSFEILLVGVK